MMAFNRVDLGKDELAGSVYATPGVTFGTKKEILEEMDRQKREKISKKAAEEMDEAAKPKVNGVETKAMQADGGMEVDSSAPNGTA